MIISSRANFAFVHIPKCAGTTVRRALDAYDDRFAQAVEHFERPGDRPEIMEIPGFGLADSHHLPLQIVRDHLPEMFASLAQSTSASIIRDPYARVMSSFAEWTKLYRNQPVQELTQTELTRLFAEVTGQVSADLEHGQLLPFQLIHFQPQSDFIELDGARIVRNLFALDDMEGFEQFVTAHFAKHGIELEPFVQSKANVSIMHRSSITRALIENNRALVNAIKQITPEPVRLKLHHMIYTNRDTKLAEFSASREVRAFVERCYQRDLEIWEAETS